MKKVAFVMVMFLVSLVFYGCSDNNSATQQPVGEIMEDTMKSIETSPADTGEETTTDDNAASDIQPNQETTQQPIQVSEKAVPNMNKFANDLLGDSEVEEYQYDSKARSITYSYNSNYQGFLEEYMQLLSSKYNFKYRKKESCDDIDFYEFDYTGSESVQSFDINYSGIGSGGNGVEFVIEVCPLDSGDTAISVYYSNDLDYMDTGDRTTQDVGVGS